MNLYLVRFNERRNALVRAEDKKQLFEIIRADTSPFRSMIYTLEGTEDDWMITGVLKRDLSFAIDYDIDGEVMGFFETTVDLMKRLAGLPTADFTDALEFFRNVKGVEMPDEEEAEHLRQERALRWD